VPFLLGCGISLELVTRWTLERTVFSGVYPSNAARSSTWTRVRSDSVDVQLYAHRVKKIGSYGMVVNGGFILGFDNETERTADMMACIQELGVSIAMLGIMYAAPNTQMTKRLQREGRLFAEGTLQKHADTEIDQMPSGLNLVTARPRVDILRDFVRIVQFIFDPVDYFERVTYTALILKTANKHRPSFVKILKALKAFAKLCRKAGFNRTTGRPFWKTLFTVLTKNPRAVEPAVSLAAMFIHFHKQSKFVIDLTVKEIQYIERCGEQHDNRSRLLKPSGHLETTEAASTV
jgi:hypothetical protein